MKYATIIAALLAAGGLRGPSVVEAAMREAAPAPERDFRQLIDIVRSALNTAINATRTPTDHTYVSLEAIYADRAVVQVGGRYLQYPYQLASVGGVDQVVLGQPVEVVEQYVPVATGTPAMQAVKNATAASVATSMVEAVQGDTGAFCEAADGSIAVTLIKAGASANKNYYPDAVLRDAVAMFEGVRVFVKDDAEHLKGSGKSVRNLIGGIYGVSFVEGALPDTGALVGTFKALDLTDATVLKMTEAVKRGMHKLLGLSIDAQARTRVRMVGGQRLREATKFTKVNSVDLIVEPGAGGGLDRLTEAAAETLTNGKNTMPLWKQRMLEAIQARDAAKFATIDAEKIGDGELAELHEAVCGAPAASPAGSGSAAGTRLAEAADDNTPVTRAELEQHRMRGVAVAKLGASKLPAAAKERLTIQFNSTTERLTESVIDAKIKDEGDYLARFTESGSVRVPAFGAGSIEVGDRSVVVKDMLEAFFDPTHKDHRSVQSIKECYIQITGDRMVTGQLRDCDMPRLRESLGSMVEAIDSTTFADALGNSITRRMQAIFTGMTTLDAWKKVATYGPVSDFRSQERVRIGGYGNLPAVAQSGSYDALSSPGDDKATYAATKRGGTESVTLEAFKNDDVQAIRRIPMELALAAKNTLYEFVFDFYRTNPTIYDTTALYVAGHNNLFTAALDATSFAAHRLAMVKQTRAGSSKRLGISSASVLVPFELQETAYNLFVRGQNLDKTYVQSINPEVIPVSYWTDANDWVTVCDQNVLPVIEIGFLDGKEEPELFVQDMANVGSMLTNDKITYKIRHIYGGDVLVDGFKGTTKAVVA